MSTGWPYPVVAELGDREKATVWEILEDQADEMRRAGGG